MLILIKKKNSMKKQVISNKNDNSKEKAKENETGITLKDYINKLIYDNLNRKLGIKNEDRNKSKK